MQLCVLGNLALDEDGGRSRTDPSRKPIDDGVEGELLDVLRFPVVGCQRMPIGDEEETLVFVLKPKPVFQHTMIVSDVQAAGRPHS